MFGAVETGNFQMKTCDIFIMLPQNIYLLGYSLEPPRPLRKIILKNCLTFKAGFEGGNLYGHMNTMPLISILLGNGTVTLTVYHDGSKALLLSV